MFWIYGDPPELLVEFAGDAPDNVRTTFVCEVSGYSRLFGIGRHSSAEDIRERFGVPSHVSIQKDGLAQMLTFTQLNLAFELEKDSVKTVCVTDHQLEYAETYISTDPNAGPPLGATR